MHGIDEYQIQHNVISGEKEGKRMGEKCIGASTVQNILFLKLRVCYMDVYYMISMFLYALNVSQ